jgi:glycosyltransferase involved in cell wall biosynthesis
VKIAVYTIALNEENFVKRWAESCKNADYRLILDTGSTDGTVDKAYENGVEVFSASIKPWRFDDARNASLALIPDDIDICISLDMDEVLVPGWREKLESIKLETTRPRYKYTWSWNDNGNPGLEYGGDKIHARHGYRWKHPVHEVLTTDRIDEIQEWIDLEIHHYPDSTKSRGQYFTLLELAINEDPYDDRNAFYYARELFYYGMHEKATQEFKRYLELPKAKWGPERAAAYRYLAKCNPQIADVYLVGAIREASDRREAYVEFSKWCYDNEMWSDCYNYALTALRIKEKPLDYLCEDFAWGTLPHDLAAISAWHLKKYSKAIQYINKALEIEPENERFLNNLAFFKTKIVI